MDAKGALATAFDIGELAFEPTEVAPNLYAMAMNTEDSLREYLRLFVKIEQPHNHLGDLILLRRAGANHR